jgi:tight adherence protein B
VPILITLFLLLAVVFMVIAVKSSFTVRDIYRERLRNVVGQNQQDAKEQKKDLRELASSSIKSISSVFAARSFTRRVQEKLVSAGIPFKGEEYITICLAAMIIIPLLTYFISSNFWLAVIVFILALIIPFMYINIKKEQRLHAFEMQLSDALVIMANALRGGFGVQQAMETVVKEMSPPITIEFDWCLREMNLGFNQEEALLHLADRVKSSEMDLVVAGIIIQRQVGGNLAQILDNIGDTMRDRARIRKQVRTLTAQGKMSGIVVGLLPVVLLAFMLVTTPENVYFFFQDVRGMVMIGTAVLMEITGVLIINQITKIEF